ncbi:secretion-regulating guanine nucleotide exchange factor isoform X3 [Rhinatrema bivittatum]|uniref:secretion-regulating guanine nucleotide exchange factor isoform X3 n=1 Tax=Rhinatrema bivittatum TaxID=194408 RepID=UPI001129ADE0|nr:secretion-regulating guanine nucleotide exchange factor isoform X3 [Rhinatrema bivittatum]XP_029438738.1 secretion-regulating guanine nucleotide exchange factor isoform X3 [Rhinatrema bivittatum]XP_029438739.1 secretion-regulating guanine nucleotide exchange factor isoform X3 [Rhinatrema bivittatum]XP_029438740.1 secretion-regulating guanine nucleotide exchange factor isoform X3 [Rhinatrema bivittatum]XP_029438741.1 secretion-regulating guanine nucleotide exchange factor isoform X3 [Rhinatre
MAGAAEAALLLTWGANSYGQLGLGHKNDVLVPEELEDFPVCLLSIRSITGGGGHSAITTAAGELFVCGQNKEGQLGLNHTRDVLRFTLCTALSSSHVVQVACGWDFTVMLTGDGQVLSCGCNSFGQLGLPWVSRSCQIPQQIEAFAEKVVHVAAGLRHALAATEGGLVFQWGTGMASQAKRACRGKMISSFLAAKEPCVVTGLEDVKVKRVTAGSYHSVSLTDGVLYVWGSNKHGQLASQEVFIAEPQKIEAHVFSGEKVEEVWSGWTHLVAKTETAKVFTWGRADYGQLGRSIQEGQVQVLPDAPDTCAQHTWSIPISLPCLTGASQYWLNGRSRLKSEEGLNDLEKDWVNWWSNRLHVDRSTTWL